MTDLKDVAAAIRKAANADFDPAAHHAVLATLQTLIDHTPVFDALDGGDLQDLIDTLTDTR